MENVLASPVRSAAPLSQKLVRVGRVLTGLTVAFLLMDGAMKLVPIAPVLEASKHLGWGADLARPVGALLCACTILHVVPRTRVLGALLLTAYLGGGTATLVRVGDPFWFPVALGVILWAGLTLRDARVRSLLVG
jgi:hypothetical protein